MSAISLPGTEERVEARTSPEINARLRAEMQGRVIAFDGAERSLLDQRIAELEHEWDIERTLETNAAAVILSGVALGAFVNRKWLFLSAAAAGFLMQHALQGWCPPLPLFRSLGVRTTREINEEINALRAMRGDFGEEIDAARALQQSSLH